MDGAANRFQSDCDQSPCIGAARQGPSAGAAPHQDVREAPLEDVPLDAGVVDVDRAKARLVGGPIDLATEILVPTAELRSRVEPRWDEADAIVGGASAPAEPEAGFAAIDASCRKPSSVPQAPGHRRLRVSGLRRYPWAELLRRVFEVEVLVCPHCGRAPWLLPAIHDPAPSTGSCAVRPSRFDRAGDCDPDARARRRSRRLERTRRG